MSGVKFIPQWMYGNFGRGGVIPEILDTTETANGTSIQARDGTMLNPLDDLQQGGLAPDGQVLAQRLHKPLYNPSSNAGAPTPVRQPSRHDPLSGSPRSNVRKGVVGGRTPMMMGQDPLGLPNRNAPGARRSSSRGSANNGFSQGPRSSNTNNNTNNNNAQQK
eukprot:GILI01003158.1.p1 GENE.GILI01003158.1~~GILI01003158.1.p1  ORF type:complete len:163 (-),score=33.69 GILI01003158.1:373-861(-)